MSFRFANPAAFQLVWLVPVLIFLAWFLSKRQLAKLRQKLGEKVVPFLTSSISTGRRRLKLSLEMLCIVFLAIALARPQSGESKQKVKSEGVEMMLVVDVSNSMLAEDARPSRLELAKKELTRLVDSLGGDKVGIIAFAGSAILLSPLTNDKAAVKMFLEGLQPNSVATQGTEFRKAIQEAKGAFDRASLAGNEGSHVTRVIVIASDGEDNEKGAFEAAEEMVDQGIRIFTLAFGTEQGGPIPERDDRGNLLGHKRDKKGQPVISTSNGKVLKDLAAAGGGSFHHVTFGSRAIEELRSDLDRLEKSEFESADLVNYDENYQIFLLFAILFALIELLFGDRRPEGRLWRGRFEVAQQ